MQTKEMKTDLAPPRSAAPGRRESSGEECGARRGREHGARREGRQRAVAPRAVALRDGARMQRDRVRWGELLRRLLREHDTAQALAGHLVEHPHCVRRAVASERFDAEKIRFADAARGRDALRLAPPHRSALRLRLALRFAL